MINTARLRCTIGWLAMMLPWVVLILSLVFGYGFPDSISMTYYRETCITPFMIVLGSASLLLFSYKGYDWQDDLVCSLTGLFGLCICLFPCATNLFAYVGTFLIPQEVSGILHNISAAIFFILLSYNSLFLFTKSGEVMSETKKKRNIIYRVCGIGMVASFVLLIPVTVFSIYGGIWTVEAIALTFFGISWLTKANYYPWLFAEKAC